MPDETTTTEAADDLDARYALALEAKRKRDEVKERKQKLAVIEREDLIARFEAETSGKLGSDFAVVDLTDVDEGFAVVKRGANVLWKTFSNSKMGDVDKEAFIMPCLAYPERAEFKKTLARAGFCSDRVATELSGLYGATLKDERGK